MAYEKKELSGSTFKNRNKAQETHADYTGDCLIDGQEYWMNTWVRKTKDGTSYFSHSFRKKQPRSDASARQEAKPAAAVIDDDLPF